MLHTILIPVLISLVASGVLFFYFRNRITVTENKVNLMFDLIQEHQKQAGQQRAALHYQQQEIMINTDNMNHPEEVPFASASGTEPELIDISDCESNGETDSDSETDSDEESNDERLKLTEDSETSKLVKILTLEGAEIGPSVGGLKDKDTLQEISSETLDNTTTIKEIKLSPDVNINSNIDSNIEDIDLSDDDGEDEEVSEEPDNSTASDNDKKTIVKKVEDKHDINKMTVLQLKAQCKEENLIGYKKMKKQSLIDLLTQNTIKQGAN